MQTLRLCILTCLCAVAVAGCTWPPPSVATRPPTAPVPAEETISDLELAEQLDLEVDAYTPSMVRLRDRRNIVAIFPDPGGEVRVNGTVLAVHGGVPVHKGRCRLPRSILDEIRPLLKTTAKPAVVVPPRPAEPVEPEELPVSGRVLLDPGHGGKDPGAHRAGVEEKDIVLDIARRTASHLKQRGVKVFVTRNTDKFIELGARVAAAAKTRPALFVSIHADSNPDPNRRGYTIFVPRRARTTSPSHQAARTMKAAFAEEEVVGWGIRSHPVNLRVLEKTRCPAVLVEIGHLSNRYDRALLSQGAYREKLAELLARAILAHLAGAK